MPVEIVAVVIRSDPKAKTRARMGKGGHWYTPNDVVTAEAQVGWAVRAALRGRLVDDLSVFAVDAKFHLKGAPRRDVDNLLKLVMDGCTGVVWRDDSQVLDARGRIHQHAAEPRTELRIGLIERTQPVERTLFHGSQAPPHVVDPPP